MKYERESREGLGEADSAGQGLRGYTQDLDFFPKQFTQG